MPNSDHFQGKSPLEHLFEARKKGSAISQENHGNSLSSFSSVFLETLKTFSVLFSLGIMSLQLYGVDSAFPVFILFGIGTFFWAPLQTALLHWRTLYKMHRLIGEEKWEIENNRDTERKELTAIYEAKGFSGKMLEQVIDVLMADDNRLLETMLTEEFGLPLENMEHPLKLALASFLAVFSLFFFMGTALFFYPISAYFFSFSFLIGSSLLSSKKEKMPLIPAFFWNSGVFLVVHLALYFSYTLIQGFFHG